MIEKERKEKNFCFYYCVMSGFVNSGGEWLGGGQLVDTCKQNLGEFGPLFH